MTQVLYVGHVGDTMGFSRAANDLCLALLQAGVDLWVYPLIRTRGKELLFSEQHLPVARRIVDDATRPLRPDVVIVHTLPIDCPTALVRLGYAASGEGGPLCIANTTWEALSMPPSVYDALVDAFDQVWVPSSVTAASMRRPGDRDFVRVVPHGFDPMERPLPRGKREDGRFRFYYIGSWTSRKNPAGVVRAFVHAFTQADDVELVVHTPACDPAAFAAAVASCGVGADRLPRIVPRRTMVPDRDIAALHREADCFVTASRGEAWNLPAFDAMLAGRRVISTRGLGSDDFLQLTTATLIDSMLAPAQIDVVVRGLDPATGRFDMTTIGAQGLTAKCMWHEPDLESLADAMRETYELRNDSIQINYDVNRFSFENVAKIARNHMES